MSSVQAVGGKKMGSTILMEKVMKNAQLFGEHQTMKREKKMKVEGESGSGHLL